MHTRLLPLLALVGALATTAWGCAPETVVSCTTTTTITTSTGTSSSATCSENPTDSVDDARMGCMVSNGGDAGMGTMLTDSFLAGPCPHAGAVGGCQLGDGNAMWFYAGWTADSVQMQCAANHGTFLTP